MSFGIENLGMLAGLAALAIPVLIHFLRRRTFDIVDWGAMQFLEPAPNVRRRWWWDDLLLLLLRMGLVAILVLALAAPFIQGSLLDSLPDGRPRDVVFILDASASMASGKGEPWAAARQRLAEELSGLGGADRAALIVAGNPPRPAQAALTVDHPWIRESLADLPGPGAAADLPAAIEMALALLRDSSAAREIVVLSDRRRAGWADPETLARWERLSSRWPEAAPRLRVLAVERGEQTGNLWLSALQTGLTTLAPGQSAAFTSGLHWQDGASLPESVTLVTRVDAAPVQSWTVTLAGAKSPLPLSFRVRLDKPGDHLVSLAIDAHDALQEDNEQHFVVETAQRVPILLVDGDEALSAKSSTYFLRQALEDDAAQPLFDVRAVPARALERTLLFQGEALGPRLCVLADVPGLEAGRAEALSEYIARGGSVLVTLGPRAAKLRDRYPALVDAAGCWFPARLDAMQGSEEKVDEAARIVLTALTHPALEYFSDAKRGLAEARFPVHHALVPEKESSVVAALDSGFPFLVEKKVGKGRVLVCSTGLDGSFQSNFAKLHAFPLLVHQLALYLTGRDATSWRLTAGAPLRLELLGVEPPETILVQMPGGKARPVVAERWPWSGPAASRPGVYSLSWGLTGRRWFVVAPDLAESDLTPLGQEDELRLAALPLWRSERAADGADEASAQPARRDIWWLLLLAVGLLLCLEIWLTRRMALARSLTA